MHQTHSDISTLDELSTFLFSKDIELNDLTSSIGKAISVYNDTTGNYPAGYRGYTITAVTNAALREVLGNRGYEKDSPNNIELTVNKDNGFAIHVVRGDQQTGLPSGFPSTLRKKGELSVEFFGLATSAINQSDMFSDYLPKYGSVKCPYDIWFLMLYAMKDDNGGIIIKAELSKPHSCSQKGMVNGFSKRYMIGMSDYNNSMIIESSDNPDKGFSDDIELDISINE